MLAEIVKCKEKGRISDNLGKMIMRIAHGVSVAPNFKRYTMRDELEAEAIVALTAGILKFDPEKSSNAHAYASQIAYRTMVACLIEVKKKDWGLKWRLLHEYATCHPEASKLASEWTLSESEEKRITEEMNKSREYRAKGMAAMKALTMVWEEGKSVKEASEATGLKEDFINRVKHGGKMPEVKERWLSERDLERPPTSYRHITEEETVNILERHFVDKVSMGRIAKETGVSLSTVSCVVRGLRRKSVRDKWLATKPKGFSLEYRKFSTEGNGRLSEEAATEIFERYFVDGMTARRVAEETGFSESYVGRITAGKTKRAFLDKWLASKPEGFEPNPSTNKGRPRKGIRR